MAYSTRGSKQARCTRERKKISPVNKLRVCDIFPVSIGAKVDSSMGLNPLILGQKQPITPTPSLVQRSPTLTHGTSLHDNHNRAGCTLSAVFVYVSYGIVLLYLKRYALMLPTSL